MEAVHVFFTIITIFTGLALLAAAGRLGGRKVGIAALALFAVYQAGYDLNDFLSALTETPMNLFASIGLFFAIAGLVGSRRNLNLFLAGVMTGMATLAKPVAVSFLPATFIAFLFFRMRTHNTSAIVRDFVMLALGFAAPLTAVALMLQGAGALDDAIRWVWMENLRYSSTPASTMDTIRHGLTRIGAYVAVSSPLWFLAAGRTVQLIRKRSIPPVEMMLILWIVFSFGTISLGGRFFPHYFLQLLPPLVVLAAIGWISWLSPVLKNMRKIRTAIASICLGGMAAGFFAFHIAEIKNVPVTCGIECEIGAFVAENTDFDSRIFVWGHNSDIYFYAKRLPASRFSYCSYLTGSSEGYEDENAPGNASDDAWRMLMDDLAEHPPALIVDMSGVDIRGYNKLPADAFPQLKFLMESHYSPYANIAGVEIWKANP